MICASYSDFRHRFADTTDRAADGLEVWPAEQVFASGFVSIVGIYASDSNQLFPHTLSVNALTSDSVKGTDEYEWYLSQRTDDSEGQFLSLTKYDPNPTAQSFSGSAVFDLTALGTDEFEPDDDGNVSGVDNIKRLYRNVHLYVKRKSDGAILWVNLFPYVRDVAPIFVIS